ncbi:MAG: hypothetical protein HY548_04960 [Elusimicrobia bacterium]|nr:hypothetical protein [Elusimicrobiota bacterium]
MNRLPLIDRKDLASGQELDPTVAIFADAVYGLIPRVLALKGVYGMVVDTDNFARWNMSVPEQRRHLIKMILRLQDGTTFLMPPVEELFEMQKKALEALATAA